MAKKRKTREQKKLADLRHTFTHSIVTHQLPQANITLPRTVDLKIVKQTPTAVSTDVYAYVVKDLSKTAFLTAIILGIQIVLFFMLKNHIFTIPALSY